MHRIWPLIPLQGANSDGKQNAEAGKRMKQELEIRPFFPDRHPRIMPNLLQASVILQRDSRLKNVSTIPAHADRPEAMK
jgi:hypothetical protein